VEAFIRGCAWEGTTDVPYPRADPADASRLPGDTWATAQVPVGVRLEFVGDAPAVEIEYTTTTDDLGYRGDGAGRRFELWRDGVCVSAAPAVLGAGVARLTTGDTTGRCIVYLPEGMRPSLLSLTATIGAIEPAPAQPRWLVYGDSIAEGWVASAPSGAWPAVAGRTLAFDIVNCGYGGSARGEVVSAEQLSAVPADVVSVSHGTNCWTRIPHSAAMVAAGMQAFLTVLRQGHPSAPIVVVSPVLRPDAESTANRLGATLADLRRAIEDVAAAHGDVTLVPGLPLLDAALLADGIHPGDEGHRALATAIGAAVQHCLR
jgi:lysophospholipase L1-like esterase